MKISDIKWNVPNILSAYRLISTIPILFFIWSGFELLFVLLFVFNQITDILDGYIARKYKMVTKEGVILDSWADYGSYLIAVYGIVRFRPELLNGPYVYFLFAFLLFYVTTIFISVIRFGKMAAGLHLYSSKINGYLQGLFLVILFAYGLVPWYFYFTMIFGILSETECIIINSISPGPVSNAKGLYWFLSSRKNNLS